MRFNLRTTSPHHRDSHPAKFLLLNYPFSSEKIMNLLPHQKPCVREANLTDTVTSTANCTVFNPYSTSISPKISELRARYEALRSASLKLSNLDPEHEPLICFTRSNK